MRFTLAKMIRRPIRRASITFRPIIIPKAHRDGLTRIMLAMVEPLATATDRISPQYERELARILQHDSADDLAEAVEAMADEISRLVLELTPDLRRWALRTERIQRDKWGRAVQAAIQVTIDSMLGPEDMRETINAFLVRSTSLVRDVNEQARGRIADAVLRGIQQRTPTVRVMREIVEATGMARARARRIAAHQSVNLASALNRERRRQAGLDVWKWNHSDKKYPRAEHVARDGKFYTDNPDRVGTLPSGQVIHAVPEDRPGEKPNCGCTEQAVLVLDGEALG